MVISNISSPSCHSASPTAPQDEVPEMELDKFSPFGSPEMGDSEISTPGSRGRNADGQGGKGRGLQLPPLKNSLHSHCFRVQLYQIEFQCEPGPRFPKSPRFTRLCSTDFSQTPHLCLSGCWDVSGTQSSRFWGGSGGRCESG